MKKLAMIITLMLLVVVYLRDPMVVGEDQRFEIKLLDETVEIYEDNGMYGQAVGGRWFFIPADNIASVKEIEDPEP